MFGFLELSTDIVASLKGLPGALRRKQIADVCIAAEKYHIYMADNSRISIAGLNPGNIDYVAESIVKCLVNGKNEPARSMDLRPHGTRHCHNAK